MAFVAAALALLIGLSLGVLGAGGSTLTVPVFAYALGLPAKQAVTASLAVVSSTAATAALLHARAGNVRWKDALVFGGVAMVGTLTGTRLAMLLSGPVQLTIFGVVMAVAAAAMFRGRRESAAAAEDGTRRHRVWRLLLMTVSALSVGLLTGVAGIGGGFMIVPALIFAGGLPMKQAVGTSLAIIAVNAAVGFLAAAPTLALPWRLIAAVTVMAVVGTWVGTRVMQHLPHHRLRRAFAIFLIATSGFVLYRNASVWSSMELSQEHETRR